MDEDAKRKLDALFEDDRGRIRAAEVKRDEVANARLQFIQDFYEKRSSTIVPAFEEFAEYVRPNGWHSSIELREDGPMEVDGRGRKVTGEQRGAATICFSREKDPSPGNYRMEAPHFSIVANRRERTVYYFESTIGRGHGGSSGATGNAKLEELTVESIQSKLTAYFEKLLRDARPFDQR